MRIADRVKEDEDEYSLYGGNIAVRTQSMTLRIILLVRLEDTSPWMTNVYAPCPCLRDDAAEASQFILIGDRIAKDEYGLVLKGCECWNIRCCISALCQEVQSADSGAVSRKCPPEG